jgi:error-prone DNA polymerase
MSEVPSGDYAELHAISNFSFLRGASHPAELIQCAHALGYRALALTDECSLAGVVRAHEAAQALTRNDGSAGADSGFKLIIGAEFTTVCGMKLVLLAPSQAAYGQICQLITLGRRRSKKGEYRVLRSDFESGLTDCLALWVPAPQETAAKTGGVQPGEARPGEARAVWLRDFFGDRGWLAVELHRGPDDRARLAHWCALAERCGVPAVAAGDVHMHVRARRALQDVLTAVRHGCTVDEAGWRLHANGERHLRSLATLRALYPGALLDQSIAIAERCAFSLSQLHYEYPAELVPAGRTASEHLRALTETGLRRRWPHGTPKSVRELIDRELALIGELRYEHFFLTVCDVVDYARLNGILCQGRGSAANSAVCYALGITEIDPARTQLLFERFISRERNEPPDIDVDFEHERREEVIQYIYDKYGRERAALAATVICYRTRSAIRDVARALGIGDEDIDRLTRMQMWWESPAQLHAALERCGAWDRTGTADPAGAAGARADRLPAPSLAARRRLRDLGRTLEHTGADRECRHGRSHRDPVGQGRSGILGAAESRCAGTRHAHGAAALFRSDRALSRQTHRDAGHPAEGHGHLRHDLPRRDRRGFPDRVAGADEHAAAPAAAQFLRPGHRGGDRAARSRSRATWCIPTCSGARIPQNVSYPSEALKAVLQRTLGVPIFQEQVMQIAIVAAGFTPGEADGLRRAMAAWKRRGGLTPYRERLLSGMAKNGYRSEFAEQIYKQILGFGEYGFPESHAASFALLTYISCWLKCHEPAAFAAALINSQPMGFYAPAQITQELRRTGVTVLPVDVTVSEWHCTLERHPSSPGPALRWACAWCAALAKSMAERIVAAARRWTLRQHR